MKTTLLDFPGRVACTVFLVGCNMRCPFCHNPRVVFGRDEIIPEEEIFSFLRKRVGILDGVCITGGEPTLYGEELISFMRRIKSMGYLIKLDTNGSDPDLLERILSQRLVDYVAMDVKSALTDEAYARACGRPVDLDDIRKSIALLKACDIPHEFRTTVVSGLHSKEDILGAAMALSGEAKAEEGYFLQSFVDSGELIGNGGNFSAYSKEEIYGFAAAACAYVPTSVRGI